MSGRCIHQSGRTYRAARASTSGGTHLIRHLLLGLGALTLASSVQAQNVQAGLWEVEHDFQLRDRPELNAQIAQIRGLLKEVPPQMKGMLEQQMAALGLGLGSATNLRVCLTPKDVQGELIREGRTEGNCTMTQVNRQGNTWSGRVTCTDPAGHGDFVARLLTPTHYTTEAKVQSEQYGRIDLKADARYVARDCGSLAR